MTVKAGQKCTAIRRIMVPENLVDSVIEKLSEKLAKVKIGDPAIDGVRMGALAGRAQVKDVLEKVKTLRKSAEIVYGDIDKFEVSGADKEKGAFCGPILLYCKNPIKESAPHDIEAFGPVSTIIPYKSKAELIELAKRGQGSLCASVVTADDNLAKDLVLAIAPYHGRIVVLNKDCIKESTGHGSPMPHLVHGRSRQSRWWRRDGWSKGRSLLHATCCITRLTQQHLQKFVMSGCNGR